MATPPNTSVQAWTRLVRAHHSALSTIEQALKKNSLPPLSWYDVLLELERAGNKGLRPFQLERALLLPQYGVSRLIERMAQAKYLKRDYCHDDRRGQNLIITKTGKNLRRKMWSVYGPAIERAIGENLNPPQAKKLAELLAKIIV